MLTLPAPLRSAASPHSRIAPGMPAAPPTTSTCPKSPLCAVLRRLGKYCSTALSSIRRNSDSLAAFAASGMSRPANTNSPQQFGPWSRNKPVLRPTNVTVRSARIAQPITAPVSPCSPVGISNASTGAGCSLTAKTPAASSPSTSRIRPLPSIPSTRRSASASTSPAQGMTTPPSAAKSP